MLPFPNFQNASQAPSFTQKLHLRLNIFKFYIYAIFTGNYQQKNVPFSLDTQIINTREQFEC